MVLTMKQMMVWDIIYIVQHKIIADGAQLL